MLKIDGAKIRRKREAKGLTQLYVATFVGVTTDTVSRWENLRYQTIKRDNAEKLAEALEVSLENILLSGEEAGHGTATVQDRRRTLAAVGKIWFWVPLLFILLFSLYWFQIDERSAPVYMALRQIPDHAPPGQIFPVMITVQTQTDTPMSIIISEKLPEGLQVIDAIPAFQSLDQQKRIVKWILSVQRKATISYIVRSGDSLKNLVQDFKGSILIRPQKTPPIVIAGNTTLRIEPYHWADTNKDNQVDDEEILTVYDLFQGLQGHDSLRTQLEAIWAGSGYSWDEREKRYVVGL